MTALTMCVFQIDNSSTSKFITKKKQINNLFSLTVLAPSRFDIHPRFRPEDERTTTNLITCSSPSQCFQF